jgi:hypothetical protein
VQSLLEVLSSVPDPRKRKGIRHGIGPLLALLLASFCTGSQTVKDAVIFGRNRRWLRKALGFRHTISPSQSTYTRLFKVLPVETLRKAIGAWLQELVRLRCEAGARTCAVSVDGKAIRGAGVHTLNIFVQDFWVLLDSFEVSEKANEMSAFRLQIEQFCERYPFVRILTFDALFCEQNTMQALSEHNRLGIFQVKENQPEALFRLQRFFSAMPKNSPDFRETEKKRGLRRHPGAVGQSPSP